MSTEHIIIVGCGAAKRDTPTKARDLYTSTYFAKKRAYAETADQWRILSAEHGLVEPDTEIEPYDTTIDDLDDQALEGWADLVTTTLEEIVVFELNGETDTIVLEVLAGQSYVEPIRSPLEIVDADNPSVDVRFPFDETSGIGDQMGWLSEQVDGEGRAVATDGGQCVGGTERREVTIDGETWTAMRHTDGRFRLFKPNWDATDRVRTPPEKGRCSYCLTGESTISATNPAKLVCDSCDDTEYITHEEREMVGDVRPLQSDTCRSGGDTDANL